MQTHQPTAPAKRLQMQAFLEAAEGIRTLDLLHGKQLLPRPDRLEMPANQPVRGQDAENGIPGIAAKSQGFRQGNDNEAVGDHLSTSTSLSVGSSPARRPLLICLRLLEQEPNRYERVAVRWLGRLLRSYSSGRGCGPSRDWNPFDGGSTIIVWSGQC
jgi:hypothetical protein